MNEGSLCVPPPVADEIAAGLVSTLIFVAVSPDIIKDQVDEVADRHRRDAPQGRQLLAAPYRGLAVSVRVDRV